jgi:hypothetical protein
MNEISTTVAFWIFDAWKRLGPQLQTGYRTSSGTAIGDVVRIIRTDPAGATLSMQAVARTIGQNIEWERSFAESRFSFDVSSEGAATMTIEFSNGNKMLIAEVPE